MVRKDLGVEFPAEFPANLPDSEFLERAGQLLLAWGLCANAIGLERARCSYAPRFRTLAARLELLYERLISAVEDSLVTRKTLHEGHPAAGNSMIGTSALALCPTSCFECLNRGTVTLRIMKLNFRHQRSALGLIEQFQHTLAARSTELFDVARDAMQIFESLGSVFLPYQVCYPPHLDHPMWKSAIPPRHREVCACRLCEREAWLWTEHLKETIGGTAKVNHWARDQENKDRIDARAFLTPPPSHYLPAVAKESPRRINQNDRALGQVHEIMLRHPHLRTWSEKFSAIQKEIDAIKSGGTWPRYLAEPFTSAKSLQRRYNDARRAAKTGAQNSPI